MKGEQLHLFSLSKNAKNTHVQPAFTFSLDKMILLGVITIILLTISFSLGVEKGKKVTLASYTKIAESNITEEKLIIGKEDTQQEDRPEEIITETETIENKIEADIENTIKNATGYRIQVASFRKENSAKEEAEILKTEGYTVTIAKKGNYIVVYVGNFNDEKEAKRKLQTLKKRYKDCILRRL